MSAPLLNLVISDTHCGSDVGLLPPKVKLQDGQTTGHGNNPFQKWLWARWQEYTKQMLKMIGDDPFILTITGDLIEGVHHRNTEEIVASRLMDHLLIAHQSFDHLVKQASKVHVIRGTECHTGDHESIFAKSIGAGKAHDVLQYRINGVLLDARHHMPTTGRLHLEAGPLSIIMANNRSNAVRAGHEPARVFLRGHRHLAGTYSDCESMVICTGAWQGLTRHGKKVVTDAIPRPSMALLDFRQTAKGELPVVRHLACNPPHDIIAHVTR